MGLFTANVMDCLGPIPDNFIDEQSEAVDPGDGFRRPVSMSFTGNTPSGVVEQKPHCFSEHKFLKPGLCFYCQKMLMGKTLCIWGYTPSTIYS